MTAVGFGGLWLCKQIREHQWLTEREFMQTSRGAAVWLFSGYFIVGLLVLFPASVMLQKRVGVPIAGPRVPRWIGWCLITIALALASFILLGLIAAAVSCVWQMNQALRQRLEIFASVLSWAATCACRSRS
jgi:hypothetical protein